ncbi:hypothetical protein [Cohnella panacarvi]|uniref:hypothetical protein n=1 Tax=Cohnella panacarvi TaxID=400776 RepID=UPI000479E7B0|nr:hypothetical protein [Cohnella panacarvi]
MGDITKNTKFINVCWTCGKHHDLGDLSFERPDGQGYKCDACPGFVISPSGKVQGFLAPVVKIFLVEDGETHRFAAKDEEECREYYKELYGEDLDEESDVTEITDPEEWNRKFIHVEDQPGLASIIDIINESTEFPTIISSTVY